MVCQNLDVMGGTINFSDFLVYPTTCYYFFWAVFFFGLFLLITFFTFNRESELFVRADIISSMAVSSTAILFLAIIGTLVKSTVDEIPMIQSDVMLYIVAFWIIISSIWFFKK